MDFSEILHPGEQIVFGRIFPDGIILFAVDDGHFFSRDGEGVPFTHIDPGVVVLFTLFYDQSEEVAAEIADPFQDDLILFGSSFFSFGKTFVQIFKLCLVVNLFPQFIFRRRHGLRPQIGFNDAA